MQPEELMTFLSSRVRVFKGFPEDGLRRLIEGGRLTTFESNEAIKKFGEEGRFIGVILEGNAQVSVTDDSGRRRLIAELVSGDIVGEMSVMTGDKTVADVISKGRSKALLIPEDLFSSVIAMYPAVIKLLSKIIAERSRSLVVDEQGRSRMASAYEQGEDPYGFRLRTEHPTKLLVINCGSSSLKYNLFDTADEEGNARGSIERIGNASGMKHVYRSSKGDVSRELPAGSYRDAFASMVELLTSLDRGVLLDVSEVSAVGHRVVHGGERFDSATLIDDAVVADIDKLSSLAPLHNPVNLAGIAEARRVFASAYHVAVFDTCFHHTLPPYAYLYGLPYRYYEEGRIRRYGFHGTSHLFVALKAA